MEEYSENYFLSECHFVRQKLSDVNFWKKPKVERDIITYGLFHLFSNLNERANKELCLSAMIALKHEYFLRERYYSFKRKKLNWV